LTSGSPIDAMVRGSAPSIPDVEDTMMHRDHTQARRLALGLVSCLVIPAIPACGN
jgi:hypothetical protein